MFYYCIVKTEHGKIFGMGPVYTPKTLLDIVNFLEVWECVDVW